MIRAIFLDLDGTLIDFQTHAVPPDALRALRLARRCGVFLALATGRCRKDTSFLDKSIAFDAYVTMNGHYCLVGDQVVYRQPIDPRDVRALLDLVAQRNVAFTFCDGRRVYCNRVDARMRRAFVAANMDLPRIEDAQAARAMEVYQIQLYVAPGEEDALLAQAPGLEGARWSADFVDLFPRGGGKRLGVEAVARHMGCDRAEVMAFGDGENDVSMLQWAGIGVAMGNAHEAVRRAADWVSAPVNQGGVALAIERFLAQFPPEKQS